MVLALVGQQLGVGQARGVIDGDVERFPAGAAPAALTSAIAGDAMTDAVDAAELLAVDVDEFARPFALVAQGLRPFIERFKRPRPRRRSTTPTLDTGKPSRRAIRGPLKR